MELWEWFKGEMSSGRCEAHHVLQDRSSGRTNVDTVRIPFEDTFHHGYGLAVIVAAIVDSLPKPRSHRAKARANLLDSGLDGHYQLVS